MRGGIIGADSSRTLCRPKEETVRKESSVTGNSEMWDAIKINENLIVSLKDIVFEFDGQKVLDGLSLDIHDKEFVTFLGPSGCGKTTTLRVIAGFVTPKSGNVFFDGKEQKLGAGYLVTATERGNNRAGESLVEFALKNNDAGAKVYRTAAEYCDRAIASATDSYLRTQYVQKKGMLKYKLRQHRIGNNYVYLAAVFSTIGAVLLIIASVDLFLELHMEFRDMFKLFSYSKMIPWEADIAMLFGAMLLFTLGKVTNKLHVASFLQLLASVFAVAVVAMHFICVINDGRVWYDKLLWYVVLVVIPLMLGKLLGEILRKIIGIQ